MDQHSFGTFSVLLLVVFSAIQSRLGSLETMYSCIVSRSESGPFCRCEDDVKVTMRISRESPFSRPLADTTIANLFYD